VSRRSNRAIVALRHDGPPRQLRQPGPARDDSRDATSSKGERLQTAGPIPIGRVGETVRRELARHGVMVVQVQQDSPLPVAQLVRQLPGTLWLFVRVVGVAPPGRCKKVQEKVVRLERYERGDRDGEASQEHGDERCGLEASTGSVQDGVKYTER